MFVELQSLVNSSEKVVLALMKCNDEQMTVVVAPVVKNPADSALATPLVLTATPAELDVGLADVLAGFTASHRSLAEQAETTKSILDAAKSAQSTKATKAITKSASKPDSTTATTDSEKGDDDDLPTRGDAKPETQSQTGGTDLSSLL